MPGLSKKQTSIIIGNLLGDGYLDKNRYGSIALEVKQKDSCKKYVFWLYEELKSLCGSLPKQRKDNYQWRLLTRYSKDLKRMYKLFYPNGRKIIPANLLEILISPLSLAVWYMDDGTLDYRVKSHFAFSLVTNCFTLEENEILIQTLRKNFKIEATIHHSLIRGKRYPRIYIGSQGRDQFYKLVRPFILECFSHKLPPQLPLRD